MLGDGSDKIKHPLNLHPAALESLLFSGQKRGQEGILIHPRLKNRQRCKGDLGITDLIFMKPLGHRIHDIHHLRFIDQASGEGLIEPEKGSKIRDIKAKAMGGAIIPEQAGQGAFCVFGQLGGAVRGNASFKVEMNLGFGKRANPLA